MSIQRIRGGVYIDLMAVAKERILPRSGRVLVPYQGDWGRPNFPVDMANTAERTAETCLLVDEVELAAENGATVVGFNITNGTEKKAAIEVATNYVIEAKYPGARGNDFGRLIRKSIGDPSKKEMVVKDTKGIFEDEVFVFESRKDLENRLKKSKMVRFVDKSTDEALDIPETTFEQLSGGVSGIGTITPTDWTRIFNQINGVQFDAMYLPTFDPAVQAAAKQWMTDRRKQERRLSQLVVAGDPNKDDDMEAHNARSRAMNARFIINNTIAGRHINGKEYNSLQWAAWLAGLVAGTPANVSMTNMKVPLEEALIDWGHSDVLKGLSEGRLMATRDGYDYVIESAVNTLTTLGPGEREDFGKIRVSMTIDQIMNDIYTAGKKYKAKLDNDSDGRAIFIGAVLEYLKIRAEQKAIDKQFSFTEHPTKKSDFDFAYFKLFAKPLDAVEAFFVDWEVA
mgnify:CR=1 FL=1